jgi:hypothetical protein
MQTRQAVLASSQRSAGFVSQVSCQTTSTLSKRSFHAVTLPFELKPITSHHHACPEYVCQQRSEQLGRNKYRHITEM